MKYAMLIYPKPGSHDLDEEQARALTAEYLALRDEPGCIGGAHLQPGEMATTVRHGGGADNLITDGPFADAKEVLAGYFVLDAADLDAALGFAARIPAVRLGGAVEVRPIIDMPGEQGH